MNDVRTFSLIYYERHHYHIIMVSNTVLRQYFYVNYLSYNMNLNLSNFTLSKAKLFIYSTYIFALITYHFCEIFITPMAFKDLVKGTTIYNVFLYNALLKLSSTQEQSNKIYT